ncbi:hypothetical protein BD414DRAFT_2329 [Trametes punicea]|nr:hypothetical protein BD414DRAFT_2329 [Trametes punicea]
MSLHSQHCLVGACACLRRGKVFGESVCQTEPETGTMSTAQSRKQPESCSLVPAIPSAGQEWPWGVHATRCHDCRSSSEGVFKTNSPGMCGICSLSGGAQAGRRAIQPDGQVPGGYLAYNIQERSNRRFALAGECDEESPGVIEEGRVGASSIRGTGTSQRAFSVRQLSNTDKDIPRSKTAWIKEED